MLSANNTRSVQHFDTPYGEIHFFFTLLVCSDLLRGGQSSRSAIQHQIRADKDSVLSRKFSRVDV